MHSKPTPSRDGRTRITVRLDFRLTLEEAGNILCAAYRSQHDNQPVPPELEPDEIRTTLRAELWHSGIHVSTTEWTYGLDHQEEGAWTAWGHRQVLRLWPGLAAAHPE